MVLFANNSIKQRPPQIIKQKMNTRKRLLKTQKINPCNQRRDKIKVLKHKIKVFYFAQKKKKVRRGLLPGNLKFRWDSVRITKDLNIESIPKVIFRDNIKVENFKLADSFACFFDLKVKSFSERQLFL